MKHLKIIGLVLTPFVSVISFTFGTTIGVYLYDMFRNVDRKSTDQAFAGITPALLLGFMFAVIVTYIWIRNLKSVDKNT